MTIKSWRLGMTFPDRRSYKAAYRKYWASLHPEETAQRFSKFKSKLASGEIIPKDRKEYMREYSRKRRLALGVKPRVILSDEERTLRRKAYLNKWRETNSEKYNAYQRIYREKKRKAEGRLTRDEYLARVRLTPEEKKERGIRKRERNREYERNRVRNYSKEPARKLSKKRRRFRERGAKTQLHGQDLELLRSIQAGRCAYCSCEMELPEIEHIVPLFSGGGNDLKNIVLSCKICNSSKGTRKLWVEWTPKDPAFFISISKSKIKNPRG